MSAEVDRLMEMAHEATFNEYPDGRQSAALRVELERLALDAARHQWLRDLKCNSLSLSRDDNHACNYMTASAWIDAYPEWFQDTPEDEVQRMRDTNTIWQLQIYPNTPVGFNVWYAATADAAIDAARSAAQKE